MSASSSTGAHLTTSRINRLLRPIHSACTSLSALSNSSPAVVTYGSRFNGSDDTTPPLALLRAPKAFGLYLQLDRGGGKALELSKRVYAVTNCFKNLVQVAFGSTQDGEGCAKMLSLSTMCAVVVGENMNTFGVEDDELAEINELFDAVPLHHRRSMLVTYALTVILNTCPHSATLLSNLLTISFSHSPEMTRDSSTILSALLALAFSPSPITPPICHPEHRKFLVDLRSRWVAQVHPFYNDRSFTRILVDQLLAVGCPKAWNCTGIVELVFGLQSCDLPACVDLLKGLCEVSVASLAVIRPERAKRDSLGRRMKDRLRPLLVRWINCLIDTFSSDQQTHSADDYAAVVDFLLLARNLGLHVSHLSQADWFSLNDQETAELDLESALACLAIHLLASHVDVYTAEEQCGLSRLLRESIPKPRTYTTLIKRMHSNKGSDGFLQHVGFYAEMLREQSLLRCEASLWSCALTFCDLSFGGGEKGLEEARAKLIDLVEDAERRCYGNGAALCGPHSPGSLRSPHPSAEWEWEEMVGAWVRKSPVVDGARRAKMAAAPETPPSRSRRLSCALRAENQTPKPREIIPQAPLSSIDRSPSVILISDSDDDKENASIFSSPICITPHRTKRIRPASDFRTLVSDALRNRTVLHGSKCQARLSHPGPKAVFILDSDSDADEVQELVAPASDDALDMFAAEWSSPLARK